MPLTSWPAGRALLRRCGVAPNQYALLVDLFGTLGERRELTGNVGMDRHALQLTSFSLLVPGAFIALFSFLPMSLAELDLMTLGFTSLLLVMLLVMEAANSLFNPSEIMVLAHRPVSGRTYFAAKFSYLVRVVAWAALALNGPVSLTALVKPEARWFFPLTHMAAALAASMCVALCTCACFGLLFRFVPIARLRSAALWMQVGAVAVPLLGPSVFRAAEGALRATWPDATARMSAVDWSIVPFAWFNAIGMLGQGGGVWPLSRWAGLGMVVAALAVALGLRTLSDRYMTRIVGVLRSSARPRARRLGPSVLARLVRALSGGPAGLAAYEFTTRLMRRDWQFRRAAAQLIVPVMFFLPLVLRRVGASPFGTSTPSLAGLLPEILPFASLAACQVLVFSDSFKGAWLFQMVPGQAIAAYLRGVYYSLWLLFVLLPITVITIWFMWRWGASDAVLFGAYSLAAASCIFGFQFLLISGLPFSKPPRPEVAYSSFAVLVIAGVVVGGGWLLQAYLIFPSRLVTLGVTVFLGWFAWRAMQYGVRTLRERVQGQLESIARSSEAGRAWRL